MIGGTVHFHALGFAFAADHGFMVVRETRLCARNAFLSCLGCCEMMGLVLSFPLVTLRVIYWGSVSRR